MKPSKMRYKEAVDAGRDFAYGRISSHPEHFDERQGRIFKKYAEAEMSKREIYQEVEDDLWFVYTGKARQE